VLGLLSYGIIAIVFVVAVVAITIYRWIRSVGSSVARIAHGSGEDAMAAMDRALAVAEIAALAVLADGEITERERDALSGALKAAGFDVSVNEALARVTGRREDVTDPAVLRAAVVRAATRLDPHERARAMGIVKDLAGVGSGLGGGEGGYRGVRRADPTALVDLFAAALEP
jgi:hypothetical protein